MSTRTATYLIKHDPARPVEALGEELASGALRALGEHPPAPVLAVAFVTPGLAVEGFLHGITRRLGTVPLVGCSTAGEFTDGVSSDGAASLMLIASDAMRVSVGLGTGLRASSQEAITHVFSALRAARGNATRDFPCRTLLVLSDGLAGNGEDLVDRLALEAGPRCALVGGAAGDDGRFVETAVFHGTRVCQDAVVVAEFLSSTPFGIGVAHGWLPTRFQRRVTRVEGNLILELDNRPAVEMYQEYAEFRGLKIAGADMPWFMMTHELGLTMPNGEIKVRAPLATTAEGGIRCATEIPLGKQVSIVEGAKPELLAAAALATRRALEMLGGTRPAGAVIFDCVARKANLGDDFHEEVEVIHKTAGDVPVIGFNTYGEIAKVKGQLSGFHNTTDVVLVIPAA